MISDLKEKGYTIKEVTGGTNSITGIALSEENITMERNTEKTVTYTFVYSDGTTVRYFAEVDGKDYEITFNNGEIKVNTEETNLGEISKEPEVTVTSSNNNIIEAKKTEEGKIILTAKVEGEAIVTVRCESQKAECKIKVAPPPPTVLTSHTKKAIPSNITWEDLSAAAKVISDSSKLEDTTKKVTNDTIGVQVTVNGKTFEIGVGDTKTLTSNGTTYTARILGFNHDELSETSAYGENNQYAGISFQFTKAIGNMGMIATPMEPHGGWNGANVRSHLNNTIWNGISNKTIIKNVKKLYYAAYNASKASISNDYLWLLSATEIWEEGKRRK